MDLGSLRDAVRKQPFQPFQVCLADGRNLNIRHPETLAIGNRVAIALLPGENADKWVVIEPLLIVSLEFEHARQSA